LAGTGRPRLVEVLRLVVRGIAVEAPHEEDRLELCYRDFEAVGLRIIEGRHEERRLLGVEVRVAPQDPTIRVPDDDATRAPADPEPPAPRGDRPVDGDRSAPIDTPLRHGHLDATVAGRPGRAAQNWVRCAGAADRRGGGPPRAPL